MTHPVGARVRSVFKDIPDAQFPDRLPDGVVIESDPTRTLIEFEEYDEDEGRNYTHRKWLPTRHWRAI